MKDENVGRRGSSSQDAGLTGVRSSRLAFQTAPEETTACNQACMVRTLRERYVNEQLLVCIRFQVQVVIFSVPLRSASTAQQAHSEGVPAVLQPVASQPGTDGCGSTMSPTFEDSMSALCHTCFRAFETGCAGFWLRASTDCHSMLSRSSPISPAEGAATSAVSLVARPGLTGRGLPAHDPTHSRSESA